MQTTQETLERMYEMRRALSAIRVYPGANEHALHEMVAAALERGGFLISHEARLAPRCRIDFLAGDIGVEIKKQRPPRGRMLAQCERYLALPALSGLILVLEKSTSLPTEINGKPVLACGLNRLWGVALP